MEKSMTFNILARKEGSLWIAHCLELDIVTTSSTFSDLQDDIIDLIITQIDYAFSNNNLENLYHPAPPEIWKEFYACNESTENKIPMKSEFQENSFVPPWIIANTCRSNKTLIV